jgi:hypothetical protein
MSRRLVWVDAPAREAWEIYSVLADAAMPEGQLRRPASHEGGSGCGDAETVASAAVYANQHTLPEARIDREPAGRGIQRPQPKIKMTTGPNDNQSGRGSFEPWL